MSPLRLFLPALLAAATLHAQTLAPELAPLATKFKADTAALEAQKAAAISRGAQTYSAALDAAEKAATTAGHVQAIAAITQERAELKGDGVSADFPNNLPAGLHTARKNYLDGVMRTVADFEQRQQRINADYLRALAALQTRVSNNSALAAQIAEEKNKALHNAAVADRSAIVGEWTFKWGGETRVRILKSDGTFVALENGKVAGKWAVSGQKLVLSWEGGATDDMFFPINPKGTKGHSSLGFDYVATKKGR